MATVNRLPFPGYRPRPGFDPIPILLAAATAVTAAVPLVYLSDTGNKKLIGAIVGGGVVLLAGFIAGNVRLACLWALMLSMTLDLSKHFGTLFEKMGGESSFKAEASDPFILILAFYLGREIWHNRRPGIRIPRVTYLWILLLAWGSLSVIFGAYRLTAAHELFRMCKVILLFLVLCNELDSPTRILQCAVALNLAMILQCGVGFVQYAMKKNIGLSLLGEAAPGTSVQLAEQTIQGDKAYRVGALMSHPNIFSVFLAVILPISIGVFLLRLSLPRKIYFLFGASVGMACLILTLSRSGWVSFTGAFIVLMSLLILHQGLRRRSLKAAIGASAALLVVCGIFAGPIIERIYSSKASAMLSRAEYVRTAKALIADHRIMGAGLNSYVFVAPRYSKYGIRGALAFYKNWYPPVHNIYYLWWSEIGIIGLSLHLILWAAIIVVGIRNLKVADETLFAINAGCLGGMVAFIIDGFFSFTLRINSIQRTFWVLSAIIFAIHYWHRRQLRESSIAMSGALTP